MPGRITNPCKDSMKIIGRTQKETRLENQPCPYIKSFIFGRDG
jgi:hypothetical protein